MRLKILGAHNCESSSARLTSLLIDGRMAVDAGSLTSTLTLDDQRGIQAILLTHHHFDHVRDLCTLGMNVFTMGPVNVYAPQSVIDVISSYLFDEVMYVDFLHRPTPEKPTLRLNPLEPYEETTIGGYTVLPLPVKHSIPAVGYQITAPDGKTLFYTGDTGKGLSAIWEAVSPDLLVIEVTVPSRYQKAAEEHGHLSSQDLKEELTEFRKIKGHLPPVVVVHMSPHIEEDIVKEVTQVAEELGAQITPGYEGMEVAIG
jgi:ribonuclease BN (tRNA processing enzyme)